MNDWIACNYCYMKPNQTVGFFLTNCGHIYCESCAKESNSPLKEILKINICFFYFYLKEANGLCIMCGNKCICYKLSRETTSDPNIGRFFQSLDSLALKQLEEIKKFVDEKVSAFTQVSNFQLEHKQKLMQHYDELEKSQMDKEKCQLLIEQ